MHTVLELYVGMKIFGPPILHHFYNYDIRILEKPINISSSGKGKDELCEYVNVDLEALNKSQHFHYCMEIGKNKCLLTVLSTCTNSDQEFDDIKTIPKVWAFRPDRVK